MDDLAGVLGGRVAEEIVFDDLTTDAADDLEQCDGSCAGNGHAVWDE